MFVDRTVNWKINRLHERALILVYYDYESTFEQLLKKDNAFTIHQRSIQSLAIEMFKTMKNENPSFMNDIFLVKRDTGYDLRGKRTEAF